jgi:hypothetical protein
MNLDVVPVHELSGDALVGVDVGLRDAGHRRVGEHHAEAKRIVGPVALDHADAMTRIGLLHQQRAV